MLLLCKKCNKEKSASEFSPHLECKSGFDTSRCKACNRARRDWAKVSPEKRIYHRAKHRAKIKKLDFNIEVSDINIPEYCPVFKKPFIIGDKDWGTSIDRLNPSKGYVKGNILIISNRANTLKNNASIEELELIIEFIKKQNIEDN